MVVTAVLFLNFVIIKAPVLQAKFVSGNGRKRDTSSVVILVFGMAGFLFCGFRDTAVTVERSL